MESHSSVPFSAATVAGTCEPAGGWLSAIALGMRRQNAAARPAANVAVRALVLLAFTCRPSGRPLPAGEAPDHPGAGCPDARERPFKTSVRRRSRTVVAPPVTPRLPSAHPPLHRRLPAYGWIPPV